MFYHNYMASRQSDSTSLSTYFIQRLKNILKKILIMNINYHTILHYLMIIINKPFLFSQGIFLRERKSRAFFIEIIVRSQRRLRLQST